MQRSRVDSHLDLLALVDRRVGAEAPDHRGVRRLVVQFLADVCRELTDVVGDGRTGVDVEVRDDLGAERLAENYVAAESPIGRRVWEQPRIFQVLRPDAEDDRPSLVGPQRGVGTQLLVVDDEKLAADRRRLRPVGRL